MQGDKVYIIGRGAGSWHARGISKDGCAYSSSNGHLHDEPWWAGGISVGYLTQAVDGCFVYDAQESCQSEEGFRAFWRAAISVPNPSYANVENEITLDTYIKGLRTVPHIKLGFVKNHEIVWETQESCQAEQLSFEF